MKFLTFTFSLFLLLTIYSCADDSEPVIESPTAEVSDPNKWNVPRDEVFDGGPGKDGIPSIDNPRFSKFNDGDIKESYLDQLIVGMVHNGQARAYPHPILDWHEIVNDKIDALSVAVTYCPLTGTGVGWDREVNGATTEFGVSGLLYNTNLMPYDRATQSTWSQQRLDCVNGAHLGRDINVVPMVETTLNTWLVAYPDSDILNENTGFNRNYGVYPYGDYRTNDSRILFPISNVDNRLPAKERVLGVFVDAKAKAYRFNSASKETEIFQESYNGVSLIVVRNTEQNFIVAFENRDNLDYSAVQNFPVVMEDELGNTYDFTGQLISGEGRSGMALPLMDSFIGYWFSWGTFYPDMELSEF